jgi:hypothetical protein
MDKEALLKFGSGSAEGWTRVRARTGSGKRGCRESRLRRACSFVEPLAALGCGEGSVSSFFGFPGFFAAAGFLDARLGSATGDDDAEDVESAERAADLEGFEVGKSASNGSEAVAVLWNRSCVVVLRCVFFAAAYGHAGRRGNWFASSCEAHREKAIRFIKEEKKHGRGRRRGVVGRGRAQRQLDGVVCVAVKSSRLPELFCQAFMPQASSSHRPQPHIEPAPRPHEPAHSIAIMGGGGNKIPYV